jgi:2-hydroxychromene-2-carboxylate isomerase
MRRGLRLAPPPRRPHHAGVSSPYPKEDDRVLELWFELASPYSYLTAMRVEPMAAAAGVRVAWRPFLLGPIFQELHGSADSPFNRNPARGRYMWIDVARRAAARGVPFRRPSQFPRGSLLGTRVALLAEDAPWIGAFVRGIYHASFVEDADIASAPVVRRVLEPLTPRAKELIENAGAPETKERLRERTRQALGRGHLRRADVLRRRRDVLGRRPPGGRARRRTRERPLGSRIGSKSDVAVGEDRSQAQRCIPQPFSSPRYVGWEPSSGASS